MVSGGALGCLIAGACVWDTMTNHPPLYDVSMGLLMTSPFSRNVILVYFTNFPEVRHGREYFKFQSQYAVKQAL